MILVFFLCGQARAVSTSATAAVLMDVDSGRILYEQNADKKMLIASTTKLLTALVALRDGNLDDIVTVGGDAAGTEGSSMYLKAGEQLTLETLLYGLLLCSGNDAAVAIADHIAGGVDAFAQRMNDLAQEIGMENSHFTNPHGLDHTENGDHYSTARDMALLAAAAANNETLLRIASTRTITIGGRTMTNHNKLLNTFSGCLGLKTGYTIAAGRTLVTCAQRNGQRLVAVTLQDGNDWADHQALYEYGFSTYSDRQGIAVGEIAGTLPVIGGSRGTVPLVAADSFSWPVAQGENFSSEISLDQDLHAPLSAGDQVGEMIFTWNGTEIGRVGLLCGQSVAPEVASALGTLHLSIEK